tara:strand:+ start:312 stop:1976 length:1665 start_codon:yes stop_codon:yes gene_type:complete
MINIELRHPEDVMKLSRLGSFHQSKLSFLRSFIREFKNWEFNRDIFDLDKDGYGVVVYSVRKNKRIYSLICFSQHINAEERSDRVIATKWDAAFVLHDGVPTKNDIERLKENVPKQEIGRMSNKELALSRANKSVRIFDHVVNSLSSGKQPDVNLLNKVGYLYRTTAVYGSGKFGLADRFRIKDRKEICGPFRLEMMLVYLVRQFTFDQINHISKMKNPNEFVSLDKKIAKNLGIGNSTGLGMAPFIVNHPTLLHQWIYNREKALKEIRSIKDVSKKEIEHFKFCLEKSKKIIDTWYTDSKYQNKKIKSLKNDLIKFNEYFSSLKFISKKYLWNEIFLWIDKYLDEECSEYLISMMMEPYDNIIEPLVKNMSSDEEKYFNIPSNRKLIELKKIIETKYKSILNINFNDKKSNTFFWFISKNKEEPRIANRFEEYGSNLEQPLAIARDIKKVYEKISNENLSKTVADFLVDNDELRHVIRRIFISEKFQYSEIQDNTISESLIPIDMLRLKLSFFGAQKFDPRSDKWLRICMYQGAPLVNEIKNSDDTWIYDSIN